MHAVDFIILSCVGQVVAWIAGLYFDPDLRRLGGHVLITTAAAILFGYLSLTLHSEGDKLAMIAIAGGGAAAVLYAARYRWSRTVDQDQ